MKTKKTALNTKELIYGIAGLVLFIILFTVVLNSYNREADKRSVEIVDEDKTQDHIKTSIAITGIDPNKGELSARIFMNPEGSFINGKGKLSKDITVYINAASVKQEFVFQKDKLISPIDVTLSLYDGLASDYPFDKHKADLYFYIETKGGKDSTGQIEDIPVSSQTDFLGSVQGYTIDAEKGEKTDDETNVIYIDIERSSSVKFFAYFVFTAMWLLCLIVVFMTLSVIVRRRKIELGMFAFMSAMIFALPSLRNMQPMSPPIGTIMDYTSFFWAEGLVALCLVTLVFTWLLRPGAKEIKAAEIRHEEELKNEKLKQ
ncbi:hypothetical protein BH10BAC5_BH10BAC5_13150 [soil metagenome]